MLGSNGPACAARAACPVVVVPRADPPARDPYGLVAPGVNGAAPDGRTTVFAFREAAPCAGPAPGWWRPPRRSCVRTRSASPRWRSRRWRLRGKPAASLVEAAVPSAAA
ncbi:hypothetical protein ACFCV9_26405 [Streptomyces sp. NPDC056367]|uniref:hypothetical protein n=1 Tax=Streptomyces sp. NPDC056367 TaxID=3345797 RepID=UPI0035DF8A26